MLALDRRVGQELCIGDDVVVKIARIKDDKVRLAISAPRSVSVDRAEFRRSGPPLRVRLLTAVAGWPAGTELPCELREDLTCIPTQRGDGLHVLKPNEYRVVKRGAPC